MIQTVLAFQKAIRNYDFNYPFSKSYIHPPSSNTLKRSSSQFWDEREALTDEEAVAGVVDTVLAMNRNNQHVTLMFVKQ